MRSCGCRITPLGYVVSMGQCFVRRWYATVDFVHISRMCTVLHCKSAVSLATKCTESKISSKGGMFARRAPGALHLY